MTTEFRIPDLGGASDVDVIEVAVVAGDQVEPEQTLLVLETDKASMEIPAEAAGTVLELKVAAGDKINEGDVFMVLDVASVTQENEEPSAPSAAAAESEYQPPVTTATRSAAAPEIQQNIVVPDLGGSEGVEVIEVAVAVGDRIDAEQTVLVLESDKATMEIPAAVAGTVVSLAVTVGDKVSQGDAMLSLQLPSGDSGSLPGTPQQDSPAATSEQPPALVAEKQPEPGTPTSSPGTPESQPGYEAPSASRKVHAGPAVRKLARELGVDLTQVTASGRKQRITKDDVQRFVKQRLSSGTAAVAASAQGIPAVPEVDFSKFGPIRQEPLNNIKRATAKAMTTAWLNVPQVTQFDLADITELESYRKQQNEVYKARGIRFSIVPFVLKAIAKVMREFPQFGASLSSDGEALIIKDYVHIGVAVDTPKGLLVPVIHNIDRLSVTEITQLLNEKAQYAREGKLTLRDMQGGCFSLSSLGGIGGTAFTPIVNLPEVAILGLSKAEFRPQWNGQEFVPRLMLPLSLSYDHRVIDGAEAARFSQRLVACLQDLRNVLM